MKASKKGILLLDPFERRFYRPQKIALEKRTIEPQKKNPSTEKTLEKDRKHRIL